MAPTNDVGVGSLTGQEFVPSNDVATQPEQPNFAGELTAEFTADLDALFRAYSAYAAGVAIRLLGRDSDVEDLVQDVFLAAHPRIHEVRDEYALRAWLVKVTVRMARRRLQIRRAKRFLHLDEPPDYGHLVSTNADQDAALELTWVYGELDKMPTDERLCWALRHLECKPLEEIVDLTELSLSTVERRIGDANARLSKARGK